MQKTKNIKIHKVIHKSLWDFRPLRYSSRDGHAEGEHVNSKFLSYFTRAHMDLSSTCKVGQKFWYVSPSVDMPPFGVTIPATVPQRSEIPEGFMNYPVFIN